MFRTVKTLSMAVALTLGIAASARADLIATFPNPDFPDDPNDCSGAFGQGFENCAIPALYDPNESPVIIKFNADGTVDEINDDLFPTVDGSEFDFDFGSNTWFYSPGEDDPAITFFVAKGGPMFNLFSNLGDPNTDIWQTPINPANGRPFGLSHLTFYDTGGGGEDGSTEVPEPSSLALFGTALALAGARLRRRQK